MKRHTCRLCNSKNLALFLDLGEHPPSDAYLTKEMLGGKEERFPLDAYLCEDCGNVQLGDVVSPDVLYRRNYPYESSTTRTGREHFDRMAGLLVERFRLGANDLVVDMGSNVGVLLGGFKRRGVKVLGVDPASDMAEIANRAGIETLPEFFTAALAEDIAARRGKAALVVGTNVFAHIDDLDDVMRGVSSLIGREGAMVIEAPHFLDLVLRLEYDTMYHEHLSYLSVGPLAKFFARHGLELFDVEKYPIHGGTIRFFVGVRGKRPVAEAVARTIAAEEAEGIHALPRLKKFAEDVAEQKKELIGLLRRLKSEGKTVVGVSAPAKGNTLLNYCGITPDLLPYITEKARIKLGLYTPGTRIPIVEDARLFADQPDYALILAWNFADEIMENLKDFKARGGKFIIPVPRPKIV